LDKATVHLGIVCPMANEAASAEAFVRAVLDQCGGFKSVVMFCVLDRVSRDGTLDIVKNLAVREKCLHLVWAPENRCVVDAYIRGYHEALEKGSDWILEIDAGFSHKPDDIPKFFEAMTDGRDCVFSTRFGKGGRSSDCPLWRTIVSRGGTVLTNLLLGTKLSDMTGSFNLFNRETLQKVLNRGVRSRSHFFHNEIKFYCRHSQFTEVPIHYDSPSNSVNWRILVNALQNLAHSTCERIIRRG